MATINKISINCSGTVVEYNIGLADTNDAGINAILSAIPIGYGTYSYSHNTSGGNTTAVLTYDEGSCDATLYSDGIGVNTANVSNCVINPQDLRSTDAGNSLIIGGDGKLFANFTGLYTSTTDEFLSFTGTDLVLTSTPLTDYHILVFQGASFIPPNIWSLAGNTITLVYAAVSDDYWVYYYS